MVYDSLVRLVGVEDKIRVVILFDFVHGLGASLKVHGERGCGYASGHGRLVKFSLVYECTGHDQYVSRV